MKAAIDIGSNSVRLLTTEGLKLSEITKLADGIETTGKLSECGAAATVAVLKKYAEHCRGGQVSAFGTAALRLATDGAEFCKTVKRETGLDIIILSPEAEARLALIGANKRGGAITVCDLGGGSMELISAADGKTPEYIKSLPIGVVVAKNRFAGDYRAAIDAAPDIVKAYGEVKSYPLTVIGGSACIIAAGLKNMPFYDASKVTNTVITARELDDFLPVLMSKKLATLRPVCAKRADTAAYGAILILALLAHLGADKFTVSDSGNLEAALQVDITDLQ